MLRSFFAHEEGQGLVEYALILVLVSVVVIVILGTLGDQVRAVFENISNELENRNNVGG